MRQSFTDFTNRQVGGSCAIAHSRRTDNVILTAGTNAGEREDFIMREIREYNINGTIILGVDNGYGNVKTAHRVFQTGIMKCDSEPVLTKEYIEYDGAYYIIGEGHKGFVADKQEDDDTYIMTLAAIAKEIEARGLTEARIHLAVGLPLKWVQAQRDSFKKYLTRERYISMKYRKVSYLIEIADCTVMPQGYAAVAENLKDFMGMNMLVDVGNGIMNIMYLNNGRPIESKSWTEKLGVNQCFIRIQNHIMDTTGVTILKHSETSQIKYDLIGKIAEGTVLTRKTVAAILQGISPIKFAMFKNNPEEFITKVIRLIKEQKATMIVEHISYDQIEGKYDSSIFTAEKHASFDKAYRAKKHIQDYVFTDGTAEKSVERRFAEELDGAKEVCVYAKLPKGFAIPTPVGSYSPDWAIAFYEGTVKHIYFIAETKGTMESLELRPIEKAKISCARKLFNEISTENVVYHDVDSYQNLLNIMNSIEK